MKNDDALSQTVTVALILAMTVIMGLAVAGVIFGENFIQRKAAYLSADIDQMTPAEKSVIHLAHKAGEGIYLTEDPQFDFLNIFIDTPQGSYLLAPPPGVSEFRPGTTLYIYNSSNGYALTNDRGLATAAPFPVPIRNVGVRLVDNASHQIIAQWHTPDAEEPGAKIITAIGPISGTLQVGNTLTAGDLTPAAATAAYQWSRSTTSGGTFTDISGATSSTYTTVAGDVGYYLKVTATGTGEYSGSATSTAAGPVATIPITAIGAISGSTQAGNTMTAGALTPSGATATYQWSRSTTSGGTYTDISGATSSTYTTVAGDIGYYLKVTATGTGSYSGSVTSAASEQIIAIPITAIGAISGSTQAGNIMTAGALTPSGATAAYQWSRSTTSGGTYTDISGATSSTYTTVAGDIGYYLKVTATGTGSYSGSVTSAASEQITTIPITAIGAISGSTQAGNTMTAGALTPSGATATYQWSRSTTSGGTYTDISGATSSTYTTVAGDIGYYLKVTATGTGSYSGSVTSAASEQIIAIPITAIGTISGSTQAGNTMTAGALTPSGATATYQWSRSTTFGGTYTDISGATSSTYTTGASDIGNYLKVTATGSGLYSGTMTSVASGPITAIPITGIGAIQIAGRPQVGVQMTAGALTPPGATASYQWSQSLTSGGIYSDISGATGSTYTPANAGYYFKLRATGTGIYSGSVTSANTTQSALGAMTITSMSGTTSGARGTTATNIRINGANYITSPYPTVVFTRSGATSLTGTVTAVQSTRVTVSLTIPSGQTTGAYSVTVTNANGATVTRANAFTVT